ncbi:MAG: hypothetical protein IPK04_10880 [Bdellovibrionales bacterium]|nr:hypothetical protein [Bdellovibrionales bacterium]
MGTVTGDAVTINLNLTPEEATAGTLVAVCSRKNSMVSDSGFWMSPSYFKNMSPGGGAGSGSTTPYLRFEFDNSGFLNSPPGATLLTKDICHQVTARLYQNGMPYPYPTVGGLSLSGLSSSFGSFYTTGSCVTPITTTSIPHLASTSAPLFSKRLHL